MVLLRDFSVFIVSGRGLNLECGVLSGERGSKDRGSLHVTCFYGAGQLYAGFLYGWIHTYSTHTHAKRYTNKPTQVNI